MTRNVARRLAAFTPLALLGGCSWDVMDPQGSIGVQNLSTLTWATLLMLIVVIPVIGLIIGFSWRYRASNLAADYAPEWSHSNRIEVVVWLVPMLIVASLAVICFRTTHNLDPYRPLVSKEKAVEVEVVSLDWKWLFIYPEYGVASVNELAMPVGRPVNFHITSATVMNSFFIPQLGSQIYAMAGMQTQVHLIAEKPGVFDGLSTNFSGAGFPDMKFTATATSQADFDAWVAKVKASGGKLGLDNYGELAKPSSKDPVKYFSSVEPVLFTAVLDKYMDKSSGLKLADKICLPTKVVAAASKERAE